jgi:hypothetical protein
VAILECLQVDGFDAVEKGGFEGLMSVVVFAIVLITT